MTESVEAVVVGAGVVGLAIARALAQAGRETLILESADHIGSEISSRNSEVIHAGIYYPQGSLKARLTGKDAQLSLTSVRMMRSEADVDSSKAKRELGWQPRPVEESIREAARFWNAMRTPRKEPSDPAT